MHLLSERATRVKLSRARAANLKAKRVGSRASRLIHQAQEPRGPMLRYLSTLQTFVASLQKDIKRAFPKDVLADVSTYRADADPHNTVTRVIGELRAGLYERIAPAKITPLIDRTSQDVSRHNGKEMKRLLGLDLTTREVGLGPLIDKFREENVALIRSIALDQLEDVQGMLLEFHALRVEDLADKLQERFGVTESRAALIARDQTLKLNGKITEARQKAVGVSQYVWTTSRDERVREEHAALDGQTFSWDDPPEPGNPGEDYQCRCTAFPVIPELSDETDDR